MNKSCKKCRVKLTPDMIYPSLLKTCHYICKPCHVKNVYKWRKENPRKEHIIGRRHRLKLKYGISLEKYDEMFKAQHGLCAVCCEIHKRRSLNVDHCHKTKVVRGLLCDRCNLALGLFDDDITIFKQFVRYLNRYANPFARH